jgi:hypothetical protein
VHEKAYHVKNFNQINIGYRGETVILYFSMPEGEGEAVTVEADLDVSRDNVPLSIELFDASDIGSERLAIVIAALKAGGLKFSHDPADDILLININAIDEDSTNARPGPVKFFFAENGLISITVGEG